MMDPLRFMEWVMRMNPELVEMFMRSDQSTGSELSGPTIAAPRSQSSMPPPPPKPSSKANGDSRIREPKVASRSNSRSPAARAPTPMKPAPRSQAPKPTIRERSRSPIASAQANPPSPSEAPPLLMEFDSPASPDPDDGFITVTKAKKRPAAASSPPPPPKAACPSGSAAGPSGRQGPSASACEADIPVSAKSHKPPPLFIQEKGKWITIAPLLTRHSINYLAASSTKVGMRVQLATSDDHRKLTQILRQEKIGFHTYALEEEKVLRVVIRNIPKEWKEDHILLDLKEQGFPVREIHRLYNGQTKTSYDLVLAILDRTPEGKAIFNLKHVLKSKVSVESPRRNNIVAQCHRCQLYGHSSRFCFAKPRCVKCLGDHGTSDCVRTKDTPEPPSCVLCGTEGHTANYRGCPKAPRSTKGTTRRPPANPRGPQPKVKANARPFADFQPAPPPLVNAWAPRPSAAAPPPPPPSVPVRTETLPPTRAKAAAPSPSASSPFTTLKEDLDFIQECTSFIDVSEIRVLAHKLRTAPTAIERLTAMVQHQGLLDAIKRSPFAPTKSN